jgi:hypothetical protein
MYNIGLFGIVTMNPPVQWIYPNKKKLFLWHIAWAFFFLLYAEHKAFFGFYWHFGCSSYRTVLTNIISVSYSNNLNTYSDYQKLIHTLILTSNIFVIKTCFIEFIRIIFTNFPNNIHQNEMKPTPTDCTILITMSMHSIST